MESLHSDAIDDDLIKYAARWASLLGDESYADAFAFTAHDLRRGWLPEVFRSVIKSCGDASPTQRVTVGGRPDTQGYDITQRKAVDRWSNPRQIRPAGFGTTSTSMVLLQM